MSMDKLENAMIDLQTQAAFQEGLLEQLNQVVTEQQQYIMRLESRLESLQVLVKSLQTTQLSHGESGHEPPPPHY